MHHELRVFRELDKVVRFQLAVKLPSSDQSERVGDDQALQRVLDCIGITGAAPAGSSAAQP
jgi:hypothetical protein